jgi:Phosphotransferase enzyme family
MRTFLTPADVAGLVADHFGTGRRLAGLDRLTGGSRKGVYRLTLDDGGTAVLYVWAAGENYWPPGPAVPDDPFTDASGAELFGAAHAALTAAGVRVPALLALDRTGRHLDADLALVEDAGPDTLESLLGTGAAAAPLAALAGSLRRMAATAGPHYGKVAGAGPAARPPEDVVLARALAHLEAAAARDTRLATAYDRIAEHVETLRAAVRPRAAYGLVHGELGPDHVLVTPAGEPVLIDIEGLTYFDVEWEHAWLRMRFAAAYATLELPGLDPDRLELYRYAQVLSLIEGPLRIAATDYPERDWMLELADGNITKALADLQA